MIVESLRKKYRWLQSLYRENWRLASALVLFSILPLLFSSLLTGWLLEHYQPVQQWLMSVGAWPVLLFGVTMATGLTPTTFVALVCGFFLGLASTGYVVVAYVLASVAGYGLGRWLDGGRFMTSLHSFPQTQKVALDIAERLVVMLILDQTFPSSALLPDEPAVGSTAGTSRSLRAGRNRWYVAAYPALPVDRKPGRVHCWRCLNRAAIPGDHLVCGSYR